MKAVTVPLPTGGAARVSLPDTVQGQDLRTVSEILALMADWWDKRQSTTPVIQAATCIQDAPSN